MTSLDCYYISCKCTSMAEEKDIVLVTTEMFKGYDDMTFVFENY